MTGGAMGSPPRVVVVGCGYWGRNLVRNLSELGALGGVCDGIAERATAMASRYQTAAVTFEQALSNPDIDALVLATSAPTHAELALRAIEAGKHVFVEKPLALQVDDALRVIEAAERHGRILMVGHLLQYHPAFLKLRQIVNEGQLGRLRYVYSNRLNLGKVRREEDVFWSFAPHDISMILALANDVPERVSAIGHCYLHSRIADVTTTHLRFASGMDAHIFVSWLHPFKEQKVVVCGDEGMAVFNDGEPWPQKLILYPYRIAWNCGVPEPTRSEAIPVTVDPAEPLSLECQHFLDCVHSGRQPRTDAQEGLGVLRVLDAASRSLASGRATEVAVAPPLRYFAHESAFVDEDCKIGAGTKIWYFSHVMRGSSVGRNCIIGQGVMIGPGVTVGDRCKIQNNVSLYTGVVLEDGVFCGPSCVFTNVINPRAEIERKDEFRPTLVGKGATIGANATIVCGHRIGPYCMIGAGAVVTRDVPAHALMIGCPARQIGWVSRAGHRLDEDLVCPRTGERYAVDERGGLILLPAMETVA
jgi:UDP-2-acetamido-3-amino-2,3-dideoxy-glucuronate N-acetyltransferase